MVRDFAPLGGSSGRASLPTTAGPPLVPSPLSPWQLAQLSAKTFAPRSGSPPPPPPPVLAVDVDGAVVGLLTVVPVVPGPHATTAAVVRARAPKRLIPSLVMF